MVVSDEGHTKRTVRCARPTHVRHRRPAGLRADPEVGAPGHPGVHRQDGGGRRVHRQHRVLGDGVKPPRPRLRQPGAPVSAPQDRKSTRLNSSHMSISYAVFCLKKKKKKKKTMKNMKTC